MYVKLVLILGFVDECVEFEKILECDVIFLVILVEGIIVCLKKMIFIKKSVMIIDLGGVKV